MGERNPCIEMRGGATIPFYPTRRNPKTVHGVLVAIVNLVRGRLFMLHDEDERGV